MGLVTGNVSVMNDDALQPLLYTKWSHPSQPSLPVYLDQQWSLYITNTTTRYLSTPRATTMYHHSLYLEVKFSLLQ